MVELLMCFATHTDVLDELRNDKHFQIFHQAKTYQLKRFQHVQKETQLYACLKHILHKIPEPFWQCNSQLCIP